MNLEFVRYKYFNLFDGEQKNIIIDESSEVKSPLYLYTFINADTNERFDVVSDSIGIDLPYIVNEDELIVGTLHNLYCYDCSKKVMKKFPLKSCCLGFLLSKGLTIVICECDVVVISTTDKMVVAEYTFSDVITDYNLENDCLRIKLMEDENWTVVKI